jgi:hypothetical protein
MAVGNVFGSNPTNERCYEFTGFSSTIEDSFLTTDIDAGYTGVTGITWDDANSDLFTADDAGDDLYRHTGFSTTIEDSHAIGALIRAISFDSSKLIAHSDAINKAIRYVYFSSTIDASFASPGTIERGISWDDTNADCLLSYDTDDAFYKMSGFTSSVDTSFSFSGVDTNPRDLEWHDGEGDLLSCANTKFYHHTGFTASVEDSFTSPVSFTVNLSHHDRYATAGDVTIEVGAASITLTGQVPALDLTEDIWVAPGAASATLTSQAPTLDLTEDLWIVPGAASATLTGQVPAIAYGPAIALWAGYCTTGRSEHHVGGPGPSHESGRSHQYSGGASHHHDERSGATVGHALAAATCSGCCVFQGAGLRAFFTGAAVSPNRGR